MSEKSSLTSFISGAVAGVTVDFLLYPIDTIKTRLQSPLGFLKSGAFTGVYSGMSSTALGSSPSAALFFVTYDLGKKSLDPSIAASLAEIVACLIRVPTDLVKQRMQVGQFKTLRATCKDISNNRGFLGFYRGFGIQVFREIPFASIQFSTYEYGKKKYTGWKRVGWGMVSGGIAAFLTTPLDVIRTRVMIDPNVTIKYLFKQFSAQPKLLMSGVVPRVIWISAGGAIFLGTYDFCSSNLAL